MGLPALDASIAVPGIGASVTIPGVGAAVSLTRPLVLVAIPVLAVALWALVLRRRDDDEEPLPGERRERRLLFATRFLVLACLVVAAAGPVTTATTTTTGDPAVTVAVDDSASMDVYEPVADDLEAGIESEGVTVNRVTLAEGNRSRLGAGLLANLRADGSVLVVSDGQVTGGPSLARAGDVAATTNATINRVELSTNRSDARVEVRGPATASVGVETTVGVLIAGVEEIPTDRTVTVTVDGEQVDSRPVPEDGTFSVSHTFNDTGPHRITAELSGTDAFGANDAGRATIRAVEKPELLYVSKGEYPLESYLRELYDVTRADSVPNDLDDYYAVVVQDVPAAGLGNVGALQRHVVGGGGLMVVGGENAYQAGNYSDSRLSTMLPVTSGSGVGERSRVVLAVDISGSAEDGMATQKALALDALDQLGDNNRVGLVAFNERAYRVAEPAELGEARDDLRTKIKRLESGGGTSVRAGLLGAGELLSDAGGTVILLSDGRDDRSDIAGAAETLREQGIRVTTIGVGDVRERTLRRIAEDTDGTYLEANETSRLRLRFGGPSRQFSGDHAVVVDDGHFVTRGVEPTAQLPGANRVSVRGAAEQLVATGYGAPAVSSWRFGLGRVVAVTAYGADGSLGDLRERPNSVLLSRSVNWAIGDPRRKATGGVATRRGRSPRSRATARCSTAPTR